MPLRSLRIVILPILLALIAGCATLYRDAATFRELDSLVNANRFEDAVELLRDRQEVVYRDKDLVLYYLDIGMLLHYAGDYDLSNQALSAAEASIEDLFAKSVSRAAASLLINDNVLEYSGEDYEDIYVNVFKTLNYLALDQSAEAFVEVRRVYEKLNLLEDKYSDLAASMNSSEDAGASFRAGKTRFFNSALARLMSLVMYESDGELDDARIDLVKIEEAWRDQPEIYPFPRPEVAIRRRSEPQRVRLLGFVGLAPEKKANTLRIHTDEDLLVIAQSNERSGETFEIEIDRIRWKGVPPGLHFKFELPYIEARGSTVASVLAQVDGGAWTELSLFESIENIAIATYEVKRPLIYLKGITRTVVKGLAAERTKREINSRVENPFLSLLGGFATDVAVDVSEAADLRTARFIPSQTYFGELELPPGTYEVVFEYRDTAGTIIHRDVRPEVTIRDGMIVESTYLR